MDVRFAPSAIGSRTARLDIPSDAPSSPDHVSLSGTGTQSADLAISKGASPNPVKTGALLTYAISVFNAGPTTASGVTVSDPLPSGTKFSSYSAGPGSCVSPAVGATGTVTCFLTSLASGSTWTITVVVKVAAAGGSTLSNTATVTSSVFDPNSSNNSATVTTKVFGRK